MNSRKWIRWRRRNDLPISLPFCVVVFVSDAKDGNTRFLGKKKGWRTNRINTIKCRHWRRNSETYLREWYRERHRSLPSREFHQQSYPSYTTNTIWNTVFHAKNQSNAIKATWTITLLDKDNARTAHTIQSLGTILQGSFSGDPSLPSQWVLTTAKMPDHMVDQTINTADYQS